jgi:uncharacterized protein
MVMIAPLETALSLGPSAGLWMAFGAGGAFGFFLERGGLGNARKLAGQFYLTDFTVFRVMFTAIVTALIGLFWFSRTGFLDLAQIQSVPTYLLPQLAGGLLFGVGFVCAGLCPGTSCVAAVTGRLDGLATLLGILAGIFLFGETFAGFRGFLYSTSLGRVTLPELLGVPHGVMVLAVVSLALGGFLALDAFERRGARVGTGAGGRSRVRLSGGRVLALGAVVLSAGGIVAGDPRPDPWGPGEPMRVESVAGTRAHYLDPVQLAEWIFDKREDFVLLDLRTAAEYERYHLPYAELRRPGAERAVAPAGRPKLVIYAGGAAIPPEALAFLDSGSYPEVYLLWGGVEGWAKRVLFPDLTRTRALTAENSARIARLSRFFGGAPKLLEEREERAPAGYLREGC